ncbi:hypothetical protein ACS0TY_004432 [Phlomoides rotata]
MYQKNDSESSQHQPENCKYCSGKSKTGYPRMKFKVSTKDVFSKSAIIAEVSETLLNNSTFGDLASDYWDVFPKDSQEKNDDLSKYRRVLSPSQVYSILKDVCPRTLESFLKRKNSIFMNSLLVTPNSHRVKEFGQRITVDETTKMYKKLVDFKGLANELSVRVLDRLKLSKLRSEKLSNIEKAYEKQSTNESASSSSGLKNIKDLILGKRTDNTFRMVVVGDPRVRVDEIGLPSYVAKNVLITDFINVWNWHKLEQICDFMLQQKGHFFVIRNGERINIWSKDMLHAGDSISRPLIDGDIVLINRPPSIHQHSLIALSVRILPTKSVASINPLICLPLRGDFDGDCLHGYVPQSITSKVELKELVSLGKQLVNGQNGRNILTLSQDSLTAAYLLLEDGVVLKKTEMQQLQMFCSCTPVLPAVIKSSSGASSWTGKQLFNLLFPPDFEFDYPSDDVSIRGGELVSTFHGSSWLQDNSENLYQCLLRHYGERALNFFNCGQELLCEWLTRRGLSVSLSDLYLSSDADSRKNLLDEVSYGLQEAQQESDISLLMVERNQNFLVDSSEESAYMESFLKGQISISQHCNPELIQASISASKSVLKDLQNLVYKYSGKDNSFITMLKAGSKGNLQKLFQHSMSLGLQHSLSLLSFSIPQQLSCASWNNKKNLPGDNSKSYIPCAIITSSFSTGLNPLECFVLSLTSRDSSFSGHADVAGTLTRRLMFFMRDLSTAYDGTVRNCLGNQVVQLNYYTKDMAATHTEVDVGGLPVGSLAACAISETAYSALDQPVSALEPSPLLALKKVLECGVKSTGCKSASLFLSRSLGRWANGFEYGALEVKDHLESLLFSDVVSEVKICFTKRTDSSTSISPWACHFHINKEVAKKRRLKVRSIIDSLKENSKHNGVRLKIPLPKLDLTSNVCSEAGIHKGSDSTLCITAALTQSLRGFSDLDILRDLVKPVLLQTVIKGFPEFKKVDILWKGESNFRYSRIPSGQLYCRVVMSKHCDKAKFWGTLLEKCLRIRNIIDWERSHPDELLDYCEAYGIDVAWQYFVNNLHSAVSDTGKTILPAHLAVTANCLSMTGEFVPLNAKGLAHQRKEANIHSPFSQACFSNPSESLIKAAKMGQTDGLRGSLEALAWGQTPSVGTGCKFDILYNGKGHEPAESTDVYALLDTHVGRAKPNDAQVCGKPITSFHLNTKREKVLLRRMVSEHISVVGIRQISQKLKRILKEHPVNQILRGEDKSVAERALKFHPKWDKKIGSGLVNIKVGRHPEYNENCFFLIRSDGTEEDFSYHKCIDHALEIIAPEKAKTYQRRSWNDVARKPAIVDLD